MLQSNQVDPANYHNAGILSGYHVKEKVLSLFRKEIYYLYHFKYYYSIIFVFANIIVFIIGIIIVIIIGRSCNDIYYCLNVKFRTTASDIEGFKSIGQTNTSIW